MIVNCQLFIYTQLKNNQITSFVLVCKIALKTLIELEAIVPQLNFFASSKSIQEYLKKNPGEIASLIRCKANHFKYNLTEKDIEELGATAWVKAQRNYYRKVYGEFKKRIVRMAKRFPAVSKRHLTFDCKSS